MDLQPSLARETFLWEGYKTGGSVHSLEVPQRMGTLIRDPPTNRDLEEVIEALASGVASRMLKESEEKRRYWSRWDGTSSSLLPSCSCLRKPLSTRGYSSVSTSSRELWGGAVVSMRETLVDNQESSA